MTQDEYARLSNSLESWVCTACITITNIHGQQCTAVTNTHEAKEHHCGDCQRTIRSNNRRICCDQCNKCFHIRCANITTKEYEGFLSSPESWVCLACIRHTNILQQDMESHRRLRRQQEVEEERGHVIFPCGICHRAVQGNHRGICCDQCNHWFHARCVNLCNSDYTRLSNSSEGWLCTHCQGSTNRQQQQRTIHIGEIT